MKILPTVDLPFQGKGNSNINTISALALLAIGTAIASFLIIKRRRKNRENPKNKLGGLIQDVRQHIKQTAEGLIGPQDKAHDVTKIQVASAGTSAWKRQLEK